MKNKLHIKIITPRGLLFSKDVDLVSLPGTAGEIGLMYDHSPLVATLKHGEVYIKEAGKVIKHYFIAEGFLQVNEKEAVVVVEYADAAEDIDLDAELKKKKEIEQKIKEELQPDERYREIIALEKTIARIRVRESANVN